MKKLIYGGAATIFAVAAVAANKPANTTTEYYWAYTTGGATLILPDAPPPTVNFSGCSATISTKCSLQATAYTVIGVGINTQYEPKAGSAQLIFHKTS